MRWDLFIVGLVIFILGALLFFGVDVPGIVNIENYLLNIVGIAYYELLTLIIFIIGIILMIVGFFSFKMGKWFKYY